ncbi:hypothetical protein [Brevibacterium sp. FAM 24630]|uniref:hypothetical protein n=1 Tax=unclassified Brevibacterium TaxID=2614124 RepID=UPI003C7AD168
MTLSSLKRYSKPRGAGDQTSGGRGKLLRATSALSRLELLVRETLQNSWDARDEEWTPAYGVRVYRMDQAVRQILRGHVFTDLPDSLADLSDCLHAPDVHAIEIFDRGTVGLNGPFRASEVARDGEENNFNSFVFDIGTTKATGQSGGTFGFGKTASFEISNAHSVVYWSRCRTQDGDVEHRLIACSLHNPYEEGNARFTGAHWWGDPDDDDIVPIRGEEAATLGEQIFRTHFGDTDDGDPETGTSILILDPVITIGVEDGLAERVPVRTDEQSEVLLQQISDALAHSAWPKVVPSGEEVQPMIVQLYENWTERPVVDAILAQYGHFASGLNSVRNEQGQLEEGYSTALPLGTVRSQCLPIVLRPRGAMVSLRSELFGGRQDDTVGHLFLIESAETSTEVDRGAPKDVLCTMRSEAELVVNYDPVLEAEGGLLQWHGVFKPTPECDRHFAASEPPTHDRWTPDAAESEASRYVVRRTLEQIRTKTKKFLSENRISAPAQEQSVRKVALGLRSFVPLGLPQEEDATRNSPRRRARRSGGPKKGNKTEATILNSTPLPDGGGQVLDVFPTSRNGESVRLRADVFAITSDGRMALDDDELTVSWRSGGTLREIGKDCIAQSGVEVELRLETRTPAALEIDLKTEAGA